ncbi:DNA helicase-2/ATP-dependent DNA helicase PcrA [Deinococcus yavapaiensis KR-236]|uniref:DNA helicase-2/ATP-dependent DNA helicase PcrA n=2 Tax=Deinococcus TaxID=1298 RepID=A0A318S5F6_9DEIO|nr:DNA helicase-2/ATP-dependent DNA helicase PcrA [Deinococcus yavapaiensis KR-236]
MNELLGEVDTYADSTLRDEHTAVREKKSKRPQVPLAQRGGLDVPKVSAKSLGHDHPDFARETTHLKGTVETMARRILKLEDIDHLDLGADDDTGFVQKLDGEAEAAELSLQLRQPYFGRMVVKIGGRVTVLSLAKYPFYDPGGQYSTTDWRSPVGQLFYNDAVTWKAGKAQGEVLLKRATDIRDRQLQGIADLYLKPGAEDLAGLAVPIGASREEAAAKAAAAAAALSGKGREDVLMARLSEAASGGMRDIVSTIQPEQDALIRAAGRAPLVVQGPAGSGKTSVAFHRAAYLAFKDRELHERIDPRASLVLMPNRVLADFASKVLSPLGLDGLPIVTPEAWMLDQLGQSGEVAVVDRTLNLLLGDADRKEKQTAWLRAKAMGDAKMLDVVRRALEARFRERLERLQFKTDLVLEDDKGKAKTVTVELTPRMLDAVLTSALERSASGEATVDGLRRTFERDLVTRLMKAAKRDDAEARLAIERQLERELAALSSRVFSIDTPLNEARRLLTRPDVLRDAAKGLLDPARVRALCSADPLLKVHVSTAAMKAGGATAGRRMGWVDVLELPVALCVKAVTSGLGRKLARGQDRYDHVLVDEAQDLSPLQYRLLREVTRSGALSLFGDASQGIHGYRGVSNWDQALAAMGGEVGSTRFLRRTYRSTRQIADLSANVAAAYAKGESYLPEAVPRDGANVRRVPCPPGESLELVTARAVKDVQALGFANVAVIRRRAGGCVEFARALVDEDVDATAIHDETGRYRGGVVVVPVHLAKGLEFDAAVVVGADESGYARDVEYDLRLLYVAVTRGQHALALVHQGVVHPLLEA